MTLLANEKRSLIQRKEKEGGKMAEIPLKAESLKIEIQRKKAYKKERKEKEKGRNSSKPARRKKEKKERRKEKDKKNNVQLWVLRRGTIRPGWPRGQRLLRRLQPIRSK